MSLLSAHDLVVRFGPVTAVDGVSLDVPSGPFGLGLVGESGSGKTTIGRVIVRLLDCDSGRITYQGRDVTHLRGGSLRQYRSNVQIVFQDPYTTLDPRQRVGSHIAEALRTHDIVPRSDTGHRVHELLSEVGLDASDFAARFPHQLSGGQRQRVAIARALAVEPSLVVLDEPTSALDVTVQSRVLALLERLREQRLMSYVLISHNLAVIERLCQQVAVLYLGRIVESADTATVIKRPLHPYSQALRLAVPELSGPSSRPPTKADQQLLGPTTGCRYHPRCPLAIDRCRVEEPALQEVTPGHFVACHRIDAARAAWRTAQGTDRAATAPPEAEGRAQR
jgi:oligopeptide/dipeptide ABC transporter ATP-binding protein